MCFVIIDSFWKATSYVQIQVQYDGVLYEHWNALCLKKEKSKNGYKSFGIAPWDLRLQNVKSVKS